MIKKIPPYAVSYFRAPGEPGYRSPASKALGPHPITVAFKRPRRSYRDRERASKVIGVIFAAFAFAGIFLSFFFFTISLAPKPLVPGTWYDQELPDGTPVKAHFLGSLKDTNSLPNNPALGDEYEIGDARWVFAVPANGVTPLWVDP